MNKRNKKKKPATSSLRRAVEVTPDAEISAVTIDQEINDSKWTCSVAMIVEKSSEYGQFISLFETAAKTGKRPVVKNITSNEIEKITLKNKANLKGKEDNTKVKLLAYHIYQNIMSYKSEDMAMMNSRMINSKFCRKDTTDAVRTGLNNIHDEPLCGPSMYFVLTGFYDPDLLLELIQLKIPLELILAFNEKELSKNPAEFIVPDDGRTNLVFENCQMFWKQFQEISVKKEFQNLSQDLVVMACDPKMILKAVTDNSSAIYDYVCLTLFDLQKDKREYIHLMNNIKEVKTLKVIGAPEIKDMIKYSELLRSVPTEAISIDFLLDCLLQQICDEEQASEDSAIKIKNQPANSSNQKEFIENTKSGDSITEASVKGIKNSKRCNNMTPFNVEYKNSRALKISVSQDIYYKFRSYHLNILSSMICPQVWKFYPNDKKSRFFAKSHYLKVKRFFKMSDVGILEHCMHRKLANRMILAITDVRNTDDLCHEVIDGYFGCATNDICFDHEYVSEEEKISDTFFMGKERPDIIHFLSDYFTSSNDGISDENESNLVHLSSIILQSDRLMSDLYNFLTCPEVDNLYIENHNVLDEYSKVEIYSKETCLNLLYDYSNSFEFIDHIYFTPTDSIIFVFHNGTDKSGYSSSSFNGHVLTRNIGLRDYHKFIRNNPFYKSWIKGRDEAIKKENEDILREQKVIIKEKEAERCCLHNVKNLGVFYADKEDYNQYQMHAPLSTIGQISKNVDDGFFLSYDLEESGIVRASEDRTFYCSKVGIKMLCRYLSFCKNVTQIVQFKVDKFSMTYDYTNYHTEPLQQVIAETNDGIKLIVSYFKKNKIVKNPNSEKDTESVESPIEGENKPQNLWHNNSFIISLPNGLEISPYVINNEIIGVRQRYLVKDACSSIMWEKFRVYLQGGIVMAFMDDNKIKVYYPNTNITEISHISSEKDFVNICGDTTTKNKNTYSVASMYKVTTWSGKVMYFKYGFCTDKMQEYNLRTACTAEKELFTVRTDGTKSILTCDGTLTVEYPDGTRITGIPKETTVILDEEDVSISYDNNYKSISNSWTLIDVDYIIEEPNKYLPVRCIDNVWVVMLPGSKEFSFKDSVRSALKWDQSELTVNHSEHQINLSTYDSQSFEYSTISILFEPEEGDIVATFMDDSDKVSLDSKGKVVLSENTLLSDTRQLDETAQNKRNSNESNFDDSGASIYVNTSESQSDEIGKSNTKESYIIEPSDMQKSFRIFVLKRDLTGYEIIHDFEARQTDVNKYINNMNIGVYNEINCESTNLKLMLWNILPEGEKLPYLKTLQVPYFNPDCFKSSQLKKKDLSHFIPDTANWLFDIPDKNKPCPLITNSIFLRNKKCFVNKSQNENRTVVIIRKITDLDSQDNLNVSLQNALNLYLEFKKKIYATILKNSVDEINVKEDNIRQVLSKTNEETK